MSIERPESGRESFIDELKGLASIFLATLLVLDTLWFVAFLLIFLGGALVFAIDGQWSIAIGILATLSVIGMVIYFGVRR